MSSFKMHFFIPCACRNQKEAVNVYGPVVTCLRPDLVKAKLFMLPLNSLLERSRAGNSHNNPHNGSERPAKHRLGHVRRGTSAPRSRAAGRSFLSWQLGAGQREGRLSRGSQTASSARSASPRLPHAWPWTSFGLTAICPCLSPVGRLGDVRRSPATGFHVGCPRAARWLRRGRGGGHAHTATGSPMFVSTEKVLTCLKSHCYGNLMRR